VARTTPRPFRLAGYALAVVRALVLGTLLASTGGGLGSVLGGCGGNTSDSGGETLDGVPLTVSGTLVNEDGEAGGYVSLHPGRKRDLGDVTVTLAERNLPDTGRFVLKVRIDPTRGEEERRFFIYGEGIEDLFVEPCIYVDLPPIRLVRVGEKRTWVNARSRKPLSPLRLVATEGSLLPCY
jgi:hypothetical protein